MTISRFAHRFRGGTQALWLPPQSERVDGAWKCLGMGSRRISTVGSGQLTMSGRWLDGERWRLPIVLKQRRRSIPDTSRIRMCILLSS